MSPYQGCQYAYRPINETTVKMDTQNVHNLQFTDLLMNLICGSKKSESYCKDTTQPALIIYQYQK